MGSLGFALLVVLVVRMAFVVVVTISATFSMVLSITVGLGFGMAVTVTVSRGALGFAALQDEGSCADTHGDDHRNGDQMLFANSGFAGVHDISQLCVAACPAGVTPPKRRFTSDAARCASARALRYCDFVAK